MATTAPAAPAAGFGRALAPLLALTLAMTVGFAMMGSFATVQESVKADLRLSDTMLGLIQGASAALALVVCSIPIGLLVDRVNRVRLMIALALVWTLGTVLTAVANGTAMLFAARVLTATGTTGALTAALSLTADLCLPAQRGRAMLVLNLGKTAGIAAAFALGGWLFASFASGAMPVFTGLAPWRGTHAVLAILSLVLTLPLLLLREPARHEVAATIHAPFAVLAAELWSRRAFLIPLFVGQVAVVMADNAALVWAAPVLSRRYGLQPGDFAGWMGALVLVSGLGGTILGGFAADLGQKSGVRGGLLVGALIAAALGVPAALFPIGPSVTWFAIALGTLTLCGAVTGLITSVALTVLLPNELRGLCIGAFIAIAGLIGFGIAPSLVTWVSGLLGGESHLGLRWRSSASRPARFRSARFWSRSGPRRRPPPATYQIAVDDLSERRMMPSSGEERIMTVTPKQRIDVSPEMQSFVGAGPMPSATGLADALTLRFDLGDADTPATVSHGAAHDDAPDDGATDDAAIVVLTVTAAACHRIFGLTPTGSAAWHLPSDLRALVVSLRDCPLREPARTTLRLAKSIELLCATFACFHDRALIPAAGAGDLSERDAGRLAAARRLIDDRWQEKLTLDTVARACGLNRAKLTRGFRQMFGSSVADAIADKRLSGAHGLLLATDLPVSAIGYRCGYQNNASFTRAFARRFGVPPTGLRARQVAA